MKKKKTIIMVLQFLLIVVFWFSFQTFVKNEVQPVDAFIFSRDIVDINTQITANDFKKVSVPAKAITTKFALNPDEIIGKYLVTKVSEGQYVYNAQLEDREDINVFDSIDLSNLRKVSLPISYVDGLAGNVKKGDKVDLVFTGEGTKKGVSGNDETFKYSKVFMQDILVFGVSTGDGYKFLDHSDLLYGETTANNGETIDVEANSDELEVITLAVTVEQVEEIQTRASAGNVKVVGRFETSEDQQTLGYVLGDYEKVFTGHANAETGRTQISEK